ncbi:MAG: patatin-like phospholipase family protein [Candidatus Dormibacteraeota bacterium]|nr:patatin-like phospholipase family protein [Candidatus Dormibacteraeota bacterium]
MSRVGLVLGAGGAAGHAFHAGVIAALQEALGWDAREAELIVGTSAGSIVAANLRAGMSGADLAALVCGEPLSAEGAALASRMGSPRPVAPRPRTRSGWSVAAPEVLRAAARRPWTVRPGAVVAGLLPPGRVPTDFISSGVRAVFGDSWPHRPTWICACDLRSGQRVVFGRTGAPTASLADAVAASCAVPALFTPVTIGGRQYVDGGVNSAENADLPIGQGLDLVLVSSIMSGAGLRGVRDVIRLRLDREVARLRAAGTEVVVLRPGRADREIIGTDFMDRGRAPQIAISARRGTLGALSDPGLRRRLAPLSRGRAAS